MTLIIAGHSLQQSYAEEKSGFCDGVFFAADSAITQGNQVLVSGFKKVVRYPIKVKAVNIAGGVFRGYHGDWYEDGCAIAFAGSTLVAQHMMNSIGNHLSDLRPTFEDGQYVMTMTCEHSRHVSGYYDEDMFQRRFMGSNYLLNANYLSHVVKHSIEAVLISSKKYDGMREYFEAYRAEFIFSVKCPEDNKYHIYQYEVAQAQDGTAVVNVEKVPFGSVAVIGKKSLFKDDAVANHKMAIDLGKSTADELFNYLVLSVKSQNEIGIFDVGMPCHLYKLRGKSLELDKRIK